MTGWHPREVRQGLCAWDIENGNLFAFTQGLVMAVLTTTHTPLIWKCLWIFPVFQIPSHLGVGCLFLKFCCLWNCGPALSSEGTSMGSKGFSTAIVPVEAVAKGVLSHRHAVLQQENYMKGKGATKEYICMTYGHGQW